MSSPEPTAVGKPTATVRLDEKDAALLARFIAADGESLFEYPSKEEVSGKKGKKDQGRRRANRDTRNLSALETLESGSANRQPAEPDEQSVAMQAEIIRLDQRGVPWRQGLIQLMAHASAYGVSATEEMLQQRRADSGNEAEQDADGDAAYDAAMAMAQQRAKQRLEQQQQLDAERRRKLLTPAQPINAAEAKAAAEAEGLQLEASDNATGFTGVRCGPATAIKRPFQAMHGYESLGYYETPEEAALVYARHTAPEKAAKAAKAKETAARAEVLAQRRAQRLAAAEAEAAAAAVLRTQPPRKHDMRMDIARYAAFAHEFNVPGAADDESYCCAFNLNVAGYGGKGNRDYGGCSRLYVCPCKHEMPPSFDTRRWRAAFDEKYHRAWQRMHADFWDGHQIRCVRNGWPSAPNGVIECTYSGCEFYWHQDRCPTVEVYALRGACPCGNNPRCVTCRHMKRRQNLNNFPASRAGF